MVTTGGQARSDRGISVRGRVALGAGSAARWASRVTGRGAGAMIGGLVAMTLDKSILGQLGAGRRSVVVTGTNGKSTTTRMTAAALATIGPVATNAEGANMDAGLVAALAGARDATLAALEVDEMHVPHVADAVDPAVVVLLNLSRDQLDRVGEINHIERTLRGGLARHPDTVVVANCDDVLMTSAAYDSPHVVWVAAGGGWANDSVSCPRSGEIIVRDGAHWYSTGPDVGPGGPPIQEAHPAVVVRRLPRLRPRRSRTADDAGAARHRQPRQRHPGRRGGRRARRRSGRSSGGGVRPSTRSRAATGPCGSASHTARVLLAKNPAGWQEALSMVDKHGAGVVIAVNGQVPDGEDLSWLWDVRFEHFEGTAVVAAGERGTDLAVRLGYAGVDHTLVHDTVKAIGSCPPGHVEVIANYTAFLQLNRVLNRGSGGQERSDRGING